MKSARARAAVRLALDEDLASAVDALSEPWCDATSLALVDPAAKATGEIYAKGTGCVVAGATVARAVMKAVDPKIQVRILKPDGSAVKPREPILVFKGRAQSILAAERTALNFMQRMCATATLTRKFVDATKRWGTLILDTRKTTPGLRVFEKYAVTCGGGTNHRMGMYDRVLMKDNHRRLWKGGDPDELDQAVVAARKAFPKLVVEVEVESLRECASALKAARVRERAQGEARVDHARQHVLRGHEGLREDVQGHFEDRGVGRHHARPRARGRGHGRDGDFAGVPHAQRGIH